MQDRSPSIILFKIFGHVLRHQDVSRVAAFHHSLRHVNSSAGNVCPLIHIRDFVDRAAMNSHPELNRRMTLQRLRNLDRTLRWCFGTGAENQSHSVARRETDQFSGGIGLLEFAGPGNDFVQLALNFALLFKQQLRITDNIDEQNMPDFQARLLRRHRAHLRARAQVRQQY
jgi:hypothetical protein